MFFFAIMGINKESKQLDFHKNAVCKFCGRYASYDGFMEYSIFSVFFIPVFKFSKKYYLKSSCCGAVFKVDCEKGRKMEYGQPVDFADNELNWIFGGNKSYGICSGCGYILADDHIFCPRCGRKK